VRLQVLRGARGLREPGAQQAERRQRGDAERGAAGQAPRQAERARQRHLPRGKALLSGDMGA